MSKQRTRKFVSKILNKTCSSLVKIIPDGKNNFTQNRYNKLQKISAKIKCFFGAHWFNWHTIITDHDTPKCVKRHSHV